MRSCGCGRMKRCTRSTFAASFSSWGIADFHRIRDDERRHGQIFRILTDTLDDRDQLRPSESAETLHLKIAQVGNYFLSHQHRAAGGVDHPLGRGGSVWVVQGRTAEQKV